MRRSTLGGSRRRTERLGLVRSASWPRRPAPPAMASEGSLRGLCHGLPGLHLRGQWWRRMSWRATRLATARLSPYGTEIRTGPTTKAAPGWTLPKMSSCEMASSRIATETRTATCERALRTSTDLRSALKSTAWRNGGRFSRASATPARAPKKMATAGCTTKRKRPGPVNRFGMSSRNCREKT